ncbi:conserved hypothetical protein [Vibrio chagasii]|nr:conserved hypothetical protein [Vibrio chagasii]
MEEQSLIIPIGNHKLAIIVAPEIATDRGFIRFFSEQERLIGDDDLLVRATKDYGNSLSTKIVDRVFGADTAIIDTVDPSLIGLPSVHTRSWFNDMFSPYSVVFFDYKELASGDLKYALVAVHWTSEDQDAVLTQAILSTPVISITSELGELF